MRNKLIIWSTLLILVFGFRFVDNQFELAYPNTWPKPLYDFKANPLNDKEVKLGRMLFYDPILSANNMISCSSCHLSYTAFTHVDHALSHGINDSIGTRNSPVLINLAWNKHFMWDGAVNNIEVQALAPISHPAEMGESIENVLIKLNKHPDYPGWFDEVYGSKNISSNMLLKSLAKFQLTLVSKNSRYDQVQAGDASFNDQELAGYQIFKKHCNSCHTEPLFTNGEFANNGLPIDPVLQDVGRYKVTQVGRDSLRFKVPTLRNIEYSQPYMHDGRMESIQEVLKHYSIELDLRRNEFSDLANNIPLSENDRVDLVAFLLTLSDREFLFNKNHAYPLNRTLNE